MSDQSERNARYEPNQEAQRASEHSAPSGVPVRPGTGWTRADRMADAWIPWAPEGSWTPIQAVEHGASLSDRLRNLEAEIARLEEEFDAQQSALQETILLNQRVANDELVGRVKGALDAMLDAILDIATGAVVDVAEVVVRTTLEERSDQLRERLKAYLALREQDVVRLRLSPGDAEVLRHDSAFESIAMKADESLNTGDLVLEYPGGEVDCRLTSLLDAFRYEVDALFEDSRARIREVMEEYSVP